MYKLPLFLVTALVLDTSLAHAATSSELGMQAYFRVVWGLAIVVALMFAIYYVVRKRFSPLYNSAEKHIKVIEMQPLMPKKTLCLVEVEGKKILLGVSGETITPLAEFDNQTEAATFANQLEVAQTEKTSNQESTAI